MPDSPAFYEERIRLLEAEIKRLRDALVRISEVCDCGAGTDALEAVAE